LNSSISENRAAAVAKALKAAGTNPNQITGAEGFGSVFAKYTAEAADSLKEKDERISISIRSK
jgi:outer membrane protein OmpA-like peptidoglycan-associated protein